MKLLSVAIPCYNSAEYMSHAIESLLVGGEDMEIIIVNDGSTDKTADIAQKYCQMYPNSIRLISQENKGHGGALNTGFAAAAGKYLKPIDADDWIREDFISDRRRSQKLCR